MNHSQIVSFLWGVADLIRDTFKRGKYQDVILPLTVLRRLDCQREAEQGDCHNLNNQGAACPRGDPAVRRGVGCASGGRPSLGWESSLGRRSLIGG